MNCEICDKPIKDPKQCWVRVTGWCLPSKTGVLGAPVKVSAPHGAACLECGYDMKHGLIGGKTESMF